MSKQVFKYPVRDHNGQPAEISIHKDAKLVHFGIDGNHVFCFWAEVPAGAVPNDVWYMRIFGTGDLIPDGGVYQSTHVNPRSGLVFHLYRFEYAVEALDS